MLVSTQGDEAEGVLDRNKTINLYYDEAGGGDEEIPDDTEVPQGDLPDTPDTPDLPDETDTGDVILDDDTPLGNLPQTGTVAEPAKNAWTLGMLAIALSMAAAGLRMTFFRKKEDEE